MAFYGPSLIWKVVFARVNPDTPIADANQDYLSLGELAARASVHIYYTPSDMTARQVDVLARPFPQSLFQPS